MALEPGKTCGKCEFCRTGRDNLCPEVEFFTTLPMSLALDKELTFRTVFRYRHIYPLAIEAVASGKINLKGVITEIFALDNIQEAMDRSVADKAGIVKSVVRLRETVD